MGHSGELVRLRRLAVLPVALLFVVGVGLVVISMMRSPEPVDLNKLAYDVGLGALIATGVATVITMYLSRIEAREAALVAERREQEAAILAAQRELAERARRDYEARWANIEKELEHLGRDMDQTTLELKVSDESWKIRCLITDTIEPILTQLYEFRKNVDPQFEHPDKPLVDEIMKRLRAEVEAERTSAEGPEGPGSAHSGEDPSA